MIYVEQPAFLPWLGFCEALIACTTVALYDDVQFSSGNWQNRNRIKTPGGVQTVTVPVVRERTTIRDTRIAASYSPHDLRSTLRHAYARAPYFGEVEEVVFPILNETKWLFDLNYWLIYRIAKALGSSVQLVTTSSIDASAIQDRDLRVAGVCETYGEGYLWAGEGTKGYINASLLRDRQIEIVWNQYQSRHPTYRQLWMKQGFVPNLSVFDAAANVGWAGLRALFVSESERHLEAVDVS